MEAWPEVTVVMPCLAATLHTHPERVRESVRSLVAQRRAPPWELRVAVDGGTPEDARRVLALVGGDPRVHAAASPKGRGPGAARSAAVRSARGRWVTSLDVGDRYRPERLARLVRAAGGGHHEAVCDRTLRIEADGSRRRGRLEPGQAGVGDLLRAHAPQSPLVAAELAAHGWPDLPYCEDLVYGLRIASWAGGIEQIGYLGLESVQHEDGQSRGYEGARRGSARAVFEEILAGLEDHGYGISSWSDREQAKAGIWRELGLITDGEHGEARHDGQGSSRRGNDVE